MKKRFLLTSVMMLLLTVFALSTATYAWFSMSTTNQVKDFTITAASAEGGLEISIDGTNFYNDAVEIGNPVLSALDVTSTDGVNFYKGYKKTISGYESDGVTPKYTETVNTAAEKNKDYFEYPIYFRTSTAGTINLDLENSYIIPESLSSKLVDSNGKKTFTAVAGVATSDTDPTIVNKAELGNFTKDWIAAATRLSYVVTGVQIGASNTWNATQTLKTETATICEPFKYSISLSQNTVTNQYTINQLDDNSKSYEAIKTISSENSVNTITSTAVTTATKGLLSSDTDPKVVTIGGDTTQDATAYAFTNGQYAIIQITVRVWIEGQDKECITPLALGKFTTGLSFYLTAAKQTEEVITLTYNTASAKANVKDGNIIALSWAATGSTDLTVAGVCKKSGTNYTLVSDSADTTNCEGVITANTFTFTNTTQWNSTWETSGSEVYYLKLHFANLDAYLKLSTELQALCPTWNNTTPPTSGDIYIPFVKQVVTD